MRPAIAESTLVISTRTLAEMRAAPASSPPLGPALTAIAAEVSLRSRTEMLAALLEREIEGRAADHVCTIWRGARAGDRAALRCLMNLLEVRLSGLELLRRALAPRQMLSACRRAARSAGEPAREAWREVVESSHALARRIGLEAAALVRPAAREAIERRAMAYLERLLDGRIREVELAWLVECADLELRATALRLGELAEQVGACDGRSIGRLLPVLSKTEERIRDTRAILVKLPAPEDLVKRTPVLVTRLEDRGYDALVREVGSRPEGLEVARAMVLASWRAPLAAELGFFAGLVRLLGDRYRARGMPAVDPARAVLLTLMARRGEGIDLDLSPMEIRSTSALWEALGVDPRSGGFTLAFDARRYEPMVPEDGVPELTYPAVRRPPDLRAIVLANVHNEHVMCGLLSMPRLATSPGLVEQVVVRSRSLKVLLEIANRRELYTGVANRNVPRALLWHPAGIPVSALRKFVHVRFVERAELAALSARGSRARPEIRQMAAAYLASLSST
jgi:hypothetical protein